MTVKIQGLIAAEGLRTVDGRLLKKIVTDADERYPAYVLSDKRSDRVGHEGSRLLGWFKVGSIWGGLVNITGELEYWPSDEDDYLDVGVDLDNLQINDDALADATLVISSGRLRALTIYADDSMRAVWPFVKIWRVSE